MTQVEDSRVPTVRFAGNTQEVLTNLGPLAGLVGKWRGHGFNLVARPDFHDSANLYLQLNQTTETLRFSPIGSAIPNRGFGQDDIQLFGIDYKQTIADAAQDGALHFEPGLWVTHQPPTTYPPEPAPPAGGQIVTRMGSIPHGNALLASGTSQPFNGPPTLASGTTPYNGSIFPSFNSTPFPISIPATIEADGTSEKLAAAAAGVAPGFQQYDVLTASGPTNPRTPFATSPPDPPLPASIRGVAMQDVINDPIRLLQQHIHALIENEHARFDGTALNICSAPTVNFKDVKNSGPTGAASTITVTDGGGGIENIAFLDGGEPTGNKGQNGQTGLVYATFWIETVHPRDRAPYEQLQYAQMVLLNFGIFKALLPDGTLRPGTDFSWPHISVATLHKAPLNP